MKYTRLRLAGVVALCLLLLTAWVVHSCIAYGRLRHVEAECWSSGDREVIILDDDETLARAYAWQCSLPDPPLEQRLGRSHCLPSLRFPAQHLTFVYQDGHRVEMSVWTTPRAPEGQVEVYWNRSFVLRGRAGPYEELAKSLAGRCR